MKIRMTEQLTGTRNGIRWPKPGEEVELPEHEAAKLLKSGQAEPVVDSKEERATTPKPETRKRARPRKK